MIDGLPDCWIATGLGLLDCMLQYLQLYCCLLASWPAYGPVNYWILLLLKLLLPGIIILLINNNEKTKILIYIYMIPVTT